MSRGIFSYRIDVECHDIVNEVVFEESLYHGIMIKGSLSSLLIGRRLWRKKEGQCDQVK